MNAFFASPPRQAVILAAGLGSRLGSALAGQPKCLAEVGGRTLLDHQLGALRARGIEEICVVLGHRAHAVMPLLGRDCQVVYNERYAETNSLYSLWLTRPVVSGGFILLNCDLFAAPEIYDRLLATPGTAIAYDSESGGESEHMKVSLDARCRLQGISKSMPYSQTHGESTGMVKFADDAVSALYGAVGVALALGGERQWAPAAFNQLTAHVPMTAVDIAGLPWAEIDSADDLDQACYSVWPAMRLPALPSRPRLVMA